MKKLKISKKLARMFSVLMLLTLGFAYCSGITAFAAVDLDVTLIPPEDSVTNAGDCEVDLDIVTKSANGYVELVINIEYDADLLALAAPVNQNGYKVTGSRGQLTLTYFDPTGTNTPTPIGNKETIPIHFTVLENAPDTVTKIRASVDHAYNNRGKNITWTPIYDKQIEIVRINQDINESDTSSEEEVSSQFVVGQNTGTVTRSTSAAANGGKVASVIFGAIVVFGAGMMAGYILCMKRYGIVGGKPTRTRHDDGGSDDDYYDDYDDYDDYGGSNDDGFYTKPGDDYTVGDDDDYLTSVPVEKSAGGGYADSMLRSAAPIGSRSLDPADFSDIFGKTDSSAAAKTDEDEYPALFMTRGSKTEASKPFFDDEDTIFGKFSANVERNVDDGYGGLSSSRGRERSERARRNR